MLIPSASGVGFISPKDNTFKLEAATCLIRKSLMTLRLGESDSNEKLRNNLFLTRAPSESP